MKKIQRIPISFSKKAEFEDSDYRFIEVVIDILHLGKNKNGSTFSKAVVEEAFPTLANTPILGYVTVSDDNIKDFKGHEHELKIDSDGVHYCYAGSAYGVIPESCNPRWIIKDDGTGYEREYLRVDGLIWTKFDDPVDIFLRDETKNQSMEITDVKTDDQSNILAFKFDGACILSTTDENIEPAMTGSMITAEFTANTIAQEIKDRLFEFTAIKNQKMEGETFMDEKKALIESFGLSVDSLDFSIEDISIDDLKSKLGEMTAENHNDTSAVPASESEGVDTTGNEGGAATFTLNTLELVDEIQKALDCEHFTDEWGYDCWKYWLIDIQGDEVIASDYEDRKIVGIPMTMDGDNVVLDFENVKRKKCVYEDWDEGSAEDNKMPMLMYSSEHVNEIVNDFKAQLSAKTDELNSAKASYEEIKPKYDEFVASAEKAAADAVAEKRSALFAVMDEKLSDNEEYVALKANDSLEYEKLELECYALLGKKTAEFTYKPSEHSNDQVETVRIGVNGAQSGGKYDELFKKYLDR